MNIFVILMFIIIFITLNFIAEFNDTFIILSFTIIIFVTSSGSNIILIFIIFIIDISLIIIIIIIIITIILTFITQ